MSEVDHYGSTTPAVEFVTDEWERDVFVTVVGYLLVLFAAVGALLAFGPSLFTSVAG